jgi:ABC-2 type transport system permease protein
MDKLLKIEWLKLRNYQTFWTLLGFFCISLLALIFFAFSLYDKSNGEIPVEVQMSSPFNFPYVWQTVSYLAGFTLVIPAVLIITLTTNEITFRTQRQNIIDGLSRIQFIYAKFLLVFILSIIFTLLVGITAILFGHYGNTPLSFINFKYILYFFCQCISYSMLSILFSLYIKKAGFAISSFILYAWVIEKSLTGILNSVFKNNLGNYLPLSTSDKLIPLPILKNVPYQSIEPGSIYNSFIMLIIYLSVIYYISVTKITNEDL